MAVLIEGISVVVQVRSILSDYIGGIDAFDRAVPNQTLCADDELVRVGFMTPNDTQRFIDTLVFNGLTHLQDEHAVDIVVVDQLGGFLSQCSWAQFGHVSLNKEGTQRIAACRLVGGNANLLSFPTGWQFERSLSRNGMFVPSEEIASKMKFLRHKPGVDVYLDLATGTEKYVGRP
jgi:hypothetical protein